MTASFPWYDLPSVRWANDVLWHATGLGGELDRTTPVDAQWRADDLVVSQACGLDLFLGDLPIEPVLAPVFDLDCAPGHYFSYLAALRPSKNPPSSDGQRMQPDCEAKPRSRKLVGSRDGVAAVNSLSSRSGFSALLSVCRPSSVIVTGSHEASLAAVRRGAAAMTCIDAVTWHILERDVPASVDGLRVLERTASAPAPPYVVRTDGQRDRIARIVTAAMADPATHAARQALLLRGVVPVTINHYAPVLAEYHAVAERSGLELAPACWP